MGVLLFLESVLTFFLVVYTMVQTYGYRKDRVAMSVSLPVCVIVYILIRCCFAVLWPPEKGGYFAYLLLMDLCGGFYGIYFADTNKKNVIALLGIYLCSINSAKVIATNIIEMIQGARQWNGMVFEISAAVLMYVLLALCTWFFCRHPLRTPDVMPRRFQFVFLMIPWGTALSVQFLIPRMYAGRERRADVLLFEVIGVAMLAVYYLSFMVLENFADIYETRRINQQLSLQLDHMERSGSMIEQIRRDKHEMKNVYFYIESLVNGKRYEELEQFVHKELAHRFDTIEEFRTGNMLVDFLMTQKVSEARSYGIHVIASILIPEKLSIEEDDLCGLLLNLLDNAIDASRKEIRGDIQIFIRQIKNYLSIKIKNRLTHDVLKGNPRLRTTKTDAGNHGIGLCVVRAIVEKYDGMMHIEMADGYFVVDVMLRM